ncbi:MAG: HDOD domain-containing protein [Desulfobulbaceae bacterium]|nr:HDOD domain-containing protein [Desulfobulbaceae bacterium]
MLSSQEIIAKVGNLPSLPTVAARINTEIESEGLSAKRLGAIISEDPALASRMLRLSNSAFYGMPRQISTIERAVMVLGFDTVKNLALSISIFSFFEKGISPAIDVIGLWNHSLGVAVCARALVMRLNFKLAEQAFLLGIVHDVGKIALVNLCLADMEQVCRLIGQDGMSEEEAEMQVFGFTHQRIGSMLIKEWKFPEMMVMAVKSHHELPPVLKECDEEIAHLIRCLCVANQFAKALALGVSTNQKREAIPSVMWGYLGVERQDIAGLSTVIREDYQRIIQSWEMD